MQSFPYKDLKDFNFFKKLKSPEKIQDYINSIPVNFEESGESCSSPLGTIKKHKAHCIEGALLAYAIFWHNGQKAFLIDLKSSKKDMDHVICVFKKDGLWGAISKSNHSTLRYRDPVYKTIRELVMSYFNEYFNTVGEKTLISYSKPFTLSSYEDDWLITGENVWAIPIELDAIPHIPIVNKKIKLKKVDQIQIDADKILEWQKENHKL
jgi:hypothetical protein